MENERPLSAHWDNACPTSISYPDHVRGLSLYMVQIYFVAGGTGVLVVPPIIASMLSIVEPELEFVWTNGSEGPVQLGLLGGVEIWVHAAVSLHEILICPEPNDLQATAMIRMSNFAPEIGPLDRLARIRP